MISGTDTFIVTKAIDVSGIPKGHAHISGMAHQFPAMLIALSRTVRERQSAQTQPDYQLASLGTTGVRAETCSPVEPSARVGNLGAMTPSRCSSGEFISFESVGVVSIGCMQMRGARCLPKLIPLERAAINLRPASSGACPRSHWGNCDYCKCDTMHQYKNTIRIRAQSLSNRCIS